MELHYKYTAELNYTALVARISIFALKVQLIRSMTKKIQPDAVKIEFPSNAALHP
jgi:hypothetical protein